MTPVLGETAEGRKTTRSDSRILPATVVYDVDLTMTLPPAISAVSGVNAIAHSGKSFGILGAFCKERGGEWQFVSNLNF